MAVGNQINRNLYISRLPHWVTEDFLRSEFDRFGLILSCKVLNDGPRGPRGVGFVQYTTPEMAIAAQKAMDQKLMGNNCISVQFAQRDKDKGIQSMPSNNVYVCNLPPLYRETDLYPLFSPFGGITSLIILEDRKTGFSKCAGLIRYNGVEEAHCAIAALNGVVLGGHDRPLEVKFAENPRTKEMRREKSKEKSTPSVPAVPNPFVQSAPCSLVVAPVAPSGSPDFDVRVPGSPSMFVLMPVKGPQLRAGTPQPSTQQHQATSGDASAKSRFAQAVWPMAEGVPNREQPFKQRLASHWQHTSLVAASEPTAPVQLAHPKIDIWEGGAPAGRGSGAAGGISHSQSLDFGPSRELSWETFASLPCSPLDHATKLFDSDDLLSPCSMKSPSNSATKSPLHNSMDELHKTEDQECEDDADFPCSPFALWGASPSQWKEQRTSELDNNDSCGLSPTPSASRTPQDIFGPFQSMFNLKVNSAAQSPSPPPMTTGTPLFSPLLAGHSEGTFLLF